MERWGGNRNIDVDGQGGWNSDIDGWGGGRDVDRLGGGGDIGVGKGIG